MEDILLDYLEQSNIEENVPYQIYDSVSEEVEEYTEPVVEEVEQVEQLEEVEEEQTEEEENEKNDNSESVRVYWPSDPKNVIVPVSDVTNDILNIESSVSVDNIRNIIDTPLNEYNITDSLLLLIFLCLFCWGLLNLIKRSIFKWN